MRTGLDEDIKKEILFLEYSCTKTIKDVFKRKPTQCCVFNLFRFHDRDQEDRGGRGGWDNKDGGYKKDGFKKDFRK